MRGPERLPSSGTEAGWSMHKTFVEAAGRGLSRLPRPRPARGRGPAEAEAGVIGRDRRPRQACFVQG
eukprot:352270-Chlamydomonas_euryale.AAC.7